MVGIPLSDRQDTNVQAIREMLGPKPPDLVVRQLELDTGAGGNRAAALVYLGGLVNAALLGENVIQPLLRDLSRIDPPEPKADFIGFLEHRVLTVPETRRETLLDTAVSGILRGDCALFVDGCRESLVLSVREYETRPIQEPTLETVIRGPKEGFTENLDTNLTLLLRRRLPDPPAAPARNVPWSLLPVPGGGGPRGRAGQRGNGPGGMDPPFADRDRRGDRFRFTWNS